MGSTGGEGPLEQSSYEMEPATKLKHIGAGVMKKLEAYYGIRTIKEDIMQLYLPMGSKS
jgi:hypothetical protein